MQTELPSTLQEAVTYFSDEDTALAFVRSMRWTGGVPVCPVCQSGRSYDLPARKMWKCKDCAKQYSVRVGTIFEDSPIKLGKWMCAFWLIVNAKNGISSYEIHRALGITQKSAWFMLHRVRLAIQNGSIVKTKGTFEADETAIGGLAKNMHKAKREARIKGRGMTGKTIVMGILGRETRQNASKVHAIVVKNTDRETLHAELKKRAAKGSKIFTDALPAYRGMDEAIYTHEAVDHAVEYVRGQVHTNGLENFWALLKRTIKGTYVSVNAEHLFRYLDEQTYRFNTRKLTGGERFLAAVAQFVGKRLTYAKLISEGGDCLPASA